MSRNRTNSPQFNQFIKIPNKLLSSQNREKKGQRWGIFINSPEMAQKIHLVNMSIKNRKIGTQKGTKFP